MVTVKTPAPLAVASEMLAPATKARLTAVPVTLAAPTDKVCVPAAPAPADAEMVIAPPEEERLMLEPATSRIGPVATVVVPAVVPPAAVEEEIPKFWTWFDPEMVMVEAFEAKPILDPATKLRLEDDPFRTKFVAIGDEIVILPAPTPTLTAPAPEIFKSPEKVPAELEVVFPRAVRLCEMV